MPIFAPSGYTGIGGSAAMPTIRLENTFNPNVTMTKIIGGHTIKAGTNIVRRQIIDYQLNQGDGNFTFSSTFTTDPNNTGRTGDASPGHSCSEQQHHALGAVCRGRAPPVAR